MTLIAALEVRENRPYLIGDLLLTSPADPDRKATTVLPAIGPCQRRFLYRDISGLRQKVCILNPDLAMAWSGDYIVARCIAREIMENMTNDNLEGARSKDMHDFIKSTGVDLDNIALIILSKVRDGIDLLAINCRKMLSSQYGRVYMAGSGEDSLRKYIESGVDLSDSAPDDVIDVSHLLTLTGKILHNEIITAKPLTNYFGGAIEIVSFHAGQFRKVNNILHTFWIVEKQTADYFRIWPWRRIIKQTYYGDMLVLECVEVDLHKEIVLREDYYLVSPIYRGVSNGEADINSIAPQPTIWTCAHVVVKERGEIRQIGTRVNFSFSGEEPLRMQRTESTLTITGLYSYMLQMGDDIRKELQVL